MAGSDQSHIRTRIQIIDLADLERLVRVGEVRHRRAAEPQINRPHETSGGKRRLHRLIVVARHEHRHPRQSAHQRKILHGLVRGAILPEGNSRVRGCEFYVGIAIGDLLAHLVVDAAGHKFCERPAERNLAGEGEACRDAHHVGFGDAALDEPFGEFRGECIHLQGAFQVCRKGDYFWILASCQNQAGAESAAGIFLSGINILLHTSNLLRFL